MPVAQDQSWWSALRHGGMLISPSRLIEAGKNFAESKQPGFPTSVEPLKDYLAEKLRGDLAKSDTGSDAQTALMTTLLENVCGLKTGKWERGNSIGEEWSRRLSTGESVRPRRVWRGPDGSVLPVFVDAEPRLGLGRGRRSVTRVIEWMRAGDQRLALITNHRQWRLIYAGIDYDCWAESDTSLWFEGGAPGPQIDALRILLSPIALTQPAQSQPSPLMRAILDSRKGEAELSAELGERVRKAVEQLIQGCAPALDKYAEGISPEDIYRAACRMIMRLVVVLFSEARDLLPVDHPIYNGSYSVGALRFELQRHGADRLRHRYSAWPRLLALFRLVHGGSPHERLPIPAYGGVLFRPGDPESDDPILRAVALFERLDNVMDDSRVADILGLVCVTRTRVRQGRSATWISAPVDFSDLSSEYIGILYEGLLDFELRRADDTTLFLNIGDQPALPLTRLEGMDDKALGSLLEKFKQRKSEAADGEEAEEEPAGDEAAALDLDSEIDEFETDQPELPEAEEPEAGTDMDGRHAAMERVAAWSRRAAIAGKLVSKPKGKKNSVDYDILVASAAKGLVARTVMQGEWYIVRWGGTRKGAGTFYTRPQLAVPTVHRTLRPLAFKGPADETGPPALWQPRTPNEILSLKVCDPAMGSGSFLVASLRYLTDSLLKSLYHHKWIGVTDDGVEFLTPPEPIPAWLAETLKDMPASEADVYARLKRVVVERCLYGVDLDALAVELGRLALWVETMDKYVPFEFLDHKLKCGNALVGCWFDRFREYPVMAWERDGGDTNHDTATHSKAEWTKAIKQLRTGRVKSELVAAITPQISMDAQLFEQAPELTHEIAFKVYQSIDEERVDRAGFREKAYANLRSNANFQQLRKAFDTWCSVWFWPVADLVNAPMPKSFLRLTEEEEKTLAMLVARYRFFHWEIEFPDVFNSERNGFDAVVGNPPWEVQKPNSKEFFSNIDPLYRAYGKQEALNRQDEMFESMPHIESDWLAYNAGFKALANWVGNAGRPFGDEEKGYSLSRAQSENRGLNDRWRKRRTNYKGFTDGARPFLHQGAADINTYKLFLEVAHGLLKLEGRMGFIVPSGVYTDQGSTEIRDLFLMRSHWHWLFCFENRDGIFDIHKSFKFCPVIVQKGGLTQVIKTAFMRRDVRDWEDADRVALSYPAAQIERFSPITKAVVEVRSHRDSEVLEKIYGNSVLLGDDGPNSWQIQYAREYDMTNDSRLFPPRTWWESRGYQPDQYGRWLKVRHVMDTALDEAGWIRLRNGGWVAEDDIEDIALPLYEGRMIGQFDFSQKGWVSGKGRTAIWRNIPFEDKVIEPQYLMGQIAYAQASDTGESSKTIRGLKPLFMGIGAATNIRSGFCSVVFDCPAGNAVPVVKPYGDSANALAFAAMFNSMTYDYVLRLRLGGINLNYFVIAETPLICPHPILKNFVSRLALSQSCSHIIFSPVWLELGHEIRQVVAWRQLWSITPHERLRIRIILDALIAELYGLDFDDLYWIMRQCDYPVDQTGNNAFTRALDSKGFWRVDKDRSPELRHTVLTLAAFADLKNTISAHSGDRDAGIADFCNQNGGGWMLPETLRLSDLGLGHDERARKPQPVRSMMGPRFLDWQLEQTPEESWAECERHARNLLGEAGFKKLQADIAAQNDKTIYDTPEISAGRVHGSITVRSGELLMDPAADAVAGETDLFGVPVQKDLFGNVVEEGRGKRKR